MRAFIFPGQASQYVGMANDLYEHFPSVQKIYDEASEISGLDLADISFNGPLEKLTETDITQPAVFTHSYAVFHLLSEKSIKAELVAGHSLGEFNALVAADVLSFSDALRIVSKRGQLMKECNQENPGTMAAILKFDSEKIKQACEETNGVVQVANFNSDGQIVISGTVEAVHEAMRRVKEMGARIVKELQVGGAFHSPLMKPAEDELAKLINASNYRNASCDVYSNVNAKAERNGDRLKELSIQQLTRSVLWFDTMQNMISDSVNEFYELGPGTVLSGILKRMKGDFNISNIDRKEHLETLIN